MVGGPQRVLVTGGASALARAAVARLVAQGRQVRWQIPPEDGDAALPEATLAQVAVYPEDLGRRFALPRLLEGCDGVLHLALDDDPFARDRDRIYRVNLEHTGHLLTAAREAGVGRFVYRGSLFALGSHPGPGGWDLGDVHLPAVQSLRLAALEAWRQGGLGLPLVAITPSFIPGAGGALGRLVAAAAAGRLPAAPATPIDVISLEDAAHALVAALSRGPAGSQLVATGAPTDLATLLGAVARGAGRRPPIPLAPGAAIAAARALRGAGSRRTASLLTLAGLSWQPDGAQARQLLGYAPRGWREALG